MPASRWLSPMAMCPISLSTSKSIRWRPYIQSLLQDRWKNNRITNEIAQSFATQMAHRACHRQRQVQDTPCHLITDARAIRGEDYWIKLIGIRKIERKRSEGNRTCCELLQREVGRGMCHTMHPADTGTWKETHQSSPVWKIRDLGSCSCLHNMQHQLHIQQGLPTKLDIEWHLWIFWHKQLNHGTKVEDDKRFAEDKSSIRSQLFIERDCHKQSFQSSSNVKWIFLLRLKSKDKATLRAFLANSNAPCKKMGQSSTILAWCIVCHIKGTNGGNTCL